MVLQVSINQIMSRRIATIAHTENIKTAAKQMGSQDIGSLFVMREKNVVGIITETDIVRHALAKDLDLTQTKVEEIMSYPVCGIEEMESIDQARRMMGENNIRHLLVTLKGQPTGVLSARNILDFSL